MSDEAVLDDGAAMGAEEIRAFLSRVMYNRRNKSDPLWNSLLVAGVPPKGGPATLGYIDMRGLTFTENFCATGYAGAMGLPLIRERWSADMDEAAARTLLEDCLRVCWYRDTRALNRIQIAKITQQGSAVSDPYVLDAKWDYKEFISSKAGVETGGSW